MSSENNNQTPDELKTAVSELTRNINRLEVVVCNDKNTSNQVRMQMRSFFAGGGINQN